MCASGSPVGNGHPRLGLPALDVLEGSRRGLRQNANGCEPSGGAGDTYGDGVRLDGGEGGRDDGDEGEEVADRGLHCFVRGAGRGLHGDRECGRGGSGGQTRDGRRGLA